MISKQNREKKKWLFEYLAQITIVAGGACSKPFKTRHVNQCDMSIINKCEK